MTKTGEVPFTPGKQSESEAGVNEENMTKTGEVPDLSTNSVSSLQKENKTESPDNKDKETVMKIPSAMEEIKLMADERSLEQKEKEGRDDDANSRVVEMNNSKILLSESKVGDNQEKESLTKIKEVTLETEKETESKLIELDNKI